ncbi:phosphotransferase [Glutamicibacter sp. AGC46]|uniref:phosphotransferase n=1 Tax=Glutamicibacter sp. 2E12 TaxID=3416181 RepID=UPI003CF37866
MTSPALEDLLNAGQVHQVRSWLGEATVVSDMSWGLTDIKVLHLDAAGKHFVLKTAGERNHHIIRELEAHRRYTRVLAEAGLAARLRFSSDVHRLAVLDYQPGELCVGTENEYAPDSHRQAGHALRLLHDQEQRVAHGYEARLTAKFLQLLERKHRIGASRCRQIRDLFTSYEPKSVAVVPTHGDWQPRNWLVDQGKLKVIDFGRFEFRPASSDFARLSLQQWVGHPELEQAFLQGYGYDPREELSWKMMQLREGLGTAVWSYEVGDESFEAQGLQMLADTLDRN